MDIQEILSEYDSMFGNKSLQEIEDYLIEKYQQAEENKEYYICVTLLNEIIGFYRDITRGDKSLFYCERLIELLNCLKMDGTIHYATSMLNTANAYRAFGLYDESEQAYNEVLDIYREKLPANDFNFASLYNNWSLLCQEVGDFPRSREMLLKALKVVDSYEAAIIPQANTRTNLGATLIQLATEHPEELNQYYQEAMNYISEALLIYEQDGGKDFHYGAALTAMGDALVFSEDYKNAATYYERAMKEVKKHVGETDNYIRIREKYLYAKEHSVINEYKKNIDRSREFYEQYGKPMLKEKYSEYCHRIAVGLVGEGSDCYGFDDEISADHDYQVGFCLWLSEADYRVIGDRLDKDYRELISKHGYKHLEGRRGVFSINRFYNRLLEADYDFEDIIKENYHGYGEKTLRIDYANISENNLCIATNGAVFEDGSGKFTKIRELLMQYYPEDIWRKKLAQTIHDFSAYGQSNYPRMMARADEITARLCISKTIEAAMDMVYLLNKRYAPYYKWKLKGMEGLRLSDNVIPLLRKLSDIDTQRKSWKDYKYSSAEVNLNDGCVRLIEELADIFIRELNVLGLAEGADTFLEGYIVQILKGKNMDIIEKIVSLEWQQFDKVKNEGGRADCQDDWNTFSLMRKSQYMAWNRELLERFCRDLIEADNRGWNLIMEKYARMMESTCPDRYAELKKDLPLLSSDRIAIQEEIIKIQVDWMVDFARDYPKMAGNARSIRTSEDNPFNTSYETYLRGELGTYSEETFVLYGRFVAELMKEGKNLAYIIMENTAKLYGYKSLMDAEERL